jgi:hypothetical protein
MPSRVLVRPRTLGSAPAIRSRSVRPRPRAGRPSGPGAKAIRNPTGRPAGPRASVSYLGPRRASRCGLLVPGFKWAAPGSGAVRSGTPPVARSSLWVEPHVSPQSPVTSCCGLLVPNSELAAPGSGAVRSGTPPVARSSRRVEQHASPQSPTRRSAALAGRRVSTVGRERRTESSRVSSEATAYRTSPALPRAGLERAQVPHPSLRCKWRHGAAEAVSRRQRTVITSHPFG